jgi:RNA polymerase sigma-70 factor (ECF subfamily)
MEDNWLAERFEAQRGHLRGVAYRILSSLNEADDAVQEAWLRLIRSETGSIENLGGWLTTVVARVCLDMLRSRNSRKEEALDAQVTEPAAKQPGRGDPEQEALLADSVGLALMVVLDRLAPAERLAFVLHDLFALPFEEIAEIVGRSPDAARQLASRARRRVQGAGTSAGAGLAQRRAVVDVFLKALRAGDVDALLAVLDPDLVVHVDATSSATGTVREVRGADNWARQAVTFSQGARSSRPALVDGEVGVIVAPRGRLFRVLRLTMRDGKIARIDVIGDEEQLRALDLAVLD